MMRSCDGTDPNLTRDCRPGEPARGAWSDSVPCDCGLTFDDVYRSTIYPHTPLSPRLTDDEIDALISACRDVGG